MSIDTVITVLVGGTFTIAILSILFAQNSPLGGVISAIGKSLGNLVVSAKSAPGAYGYQT